MIVNGILQERGGHRRLFTAQCGLHLEGNRKEVVRQLVGDHFYFCRALAVRRPSLAEGMSNSRAFCLHPDSIVLNPYEIYRNANEAKMNNKRRFEIRFEGRFADGQMLPVAILSQALSAMQRAVHLLAMQHENVSVRQRERVSKSVEAKYPLLCSLPKPGSYIVPVEIGDPSVELFALEDVEAVGGLFSLCCDSIATGNASGLADAIPDHSRRDRFIEAIRAMSPAQGSGIKAGISQPGGALKVALDTLHEHGKACLSASTDPERQVRTITGRLSEIQFDERKIKIVYPSNNRELECSYSEALEEMLLERPRELIQVTGEVIIDENDLPKKINNVESIEEVDFSPFYLTTVEHGARKFVFDKPLVLTPELDESQQLYCLTKPELGIDVYAYTREQLHMELQEQIAFLWDTYALADDEELADTAIAIKQNLRAALQEVTDAA